MKTSKSDNSKGMGQKTNGTPRQGMTEALRSSSSLGTVQTPPVASEKSAPALSSNVVPLRPARSELSHQQIAERANAIWIQCGRAPGRDQANWYEAEAQLKADLAIK